MSKPRCSASWLSEDMAAALAATCPPLEVDAVVRAANELVLRTDPAEIATRLLLQGAGLLSARRIVEALRALQDRNA